MFIERLKEKFGEDVPIFTNEILEEFKEFTKAYVFRLLNKSIEKKEIVKFCTGVYFIPSETIIGPSTIIAEDVANKKYISNDDDVYGVYSGIYLENLFHQTTQVPNTIEIVTNNESTRSRNININGRKFIVKKSRCVITKENYKEYTLLELFSNVSCESIIDIETIKKYVEENSIDKDNLLETAKFFPSSTVKNLVCSGVL